VDAVSTFADPTQKRAIRAYVAALPPATRRAFKLARATIRDAVPDVEEGFSYRIPAFRLHGAMLVWCAGWTAHLSIYPVTPAMAKAGGARLARYRASKGTLKFALDEPLPTAFITRLMRARASEIRG
jgi:uncharacterized protein YdhG (YjbR/CyaY superfamily)